MKRNARNPDVPLNWFGTEPWPAATTSDGSRRTCDVHDTTRAPWLSSDAVSLDSMALVRGSLAVANVTREARKLAASAGTTIVVSPRRTKRREPRARRDESMSARLCSRKETRFADCVLYSTGSKQKTGTM